MPAVIPPWIKPADPATHMAQGMHIGIQIGAQAAEERIKQQQIAARQIQADQEMQAQEAAQRFKQVQAEKNDQMAARDQALAEQKFSLAASQAAQKHQAMQEYQSAVGGGMDPNEAMLKWGPAMSANTGAAAAIRAHERESRQPLIPREITLPSGMSGVITGNRFQYAPKPPSGALAKVPEGAEFVPATEDAPAHWTLPKKVEKSGLSENQRMLRLEKINKSLMDLQEKSTMDISPESQPDPKWNKRTLSQWQSAKKMAADLNKEKEQMEAAILGASTPAEKKTGRVRVKSPEGKVGSISAEQLDDALAHGYTQL